MVSSASAHALPGLMHSSPRFGTADQHQRRYHEKLMPDMENSDELVIGAYRYHYWCTAYATGDGSTTTDNGECLKLRNQTLPATTVEAEQVEPKNSNRKMQEAHDDDERTTRHA